MRAQTRPLGAVTAAALTLGLVAPAMAQTEIAREGAPTSERRAALSQMELQPFDASLFEGLDGWRNGTPLTASAIDGKVVLLYTWAHWKPASVRSLPLLQELHERHAGDGLVIVGVHDNRFYDGAGEAADNAGVEFPIAHDAGNALRDALLVDQDPDLYLIDRAGQLRYADIVNTEVRRAVESLLAEDAEAASTIEERRAQADRDARDAARRSERANESYDPSKVPHVDFPRPSQVAYDTANWPLMPDKDRQDDMGGSRNDTLRRIEMPTSNWDGKAPEFDGRVTVLYFWAPEIRASYLDTMPYMEKLQAKYGNDVVVVGVLSDWRRLSGERDNRRNNEGVNLDTARLRTQLLEFRRARDLNHELYYNPDVDLLKVIRDTQRGSDQIFVPYAAVISTDGVVRWHGFIGNTKQLDPGAANRGDMFEIGTNIFEPAVERTIRVDPGVRARREAEKNLLRNAFDR